MSGKINCRSGLTSLRDAGNLQLMRRWFRFRSDLGLQLLALYLLLIVPFLLALWVFDGLVGQRIREDAQASDTSLAQAIAQETDL